MSFDVGDKVVYPHHGAAIIERREKRNVFGENREYLVLKLAYGDLTLMVPCDNTEEVGLREVINDEEVEEVFAVLRKKEARMPTNWSRRFKNHVEKLKSGDIYQVAEVHAHQGPPDPGLGVDLRHQRHRGRGRAAPRRRSSVGVQAHCSRPPGQTGGLLRVKGGCPGADHSQEESCSSRLPVF